jgi:LPS-assembly lipoprotein
MKQLPTICIILTLLLSSCGFALRGKILIPSELKNAQILPSNNVSSDLKLQMARELRFLPAEEAPKSPTPTKNPPLTILLQNELNDEQVTSISSSTTPRQYLLHQSVVFSVKIGEDFIIHNQTVAATRQFTSNSDNILGSNYEGDLLQREMHRDLVRQIITRIMRAKDIKEQSSNANKIPKSP